MKKTIYIPKGQTLEFDTLTCDRTVVNGCLRVTGGIVVKRIQGNGVVQANIIKADSVVCDDLTVGSVITNVLMAKRVSAVEVHAASSVTVSTFIEAGYVKTPKAVVAESEIEDMCADEIIKLKPKARSLWTALFISTLRSLWIEILFWLKNSFENIAADQYEVEPDADDQDGMDVDDGGISSAETELLKDPEFRKFVKIFKAFKNGDLVSPFQQGDTWPEPETIHQFSAAKNPQEAA